MAGLWYDFFLSSLKIQQSICLGAVIWIDGHKPIDFKGEKLYDVDGWSQKKLEGARNYGGRRGGIQIEQSRPAWSSLLYCVLLLTSTQGFLLKTEAAKFWEVQRAYVLDWTCSRDPYKLVDIPEGTNLPLYNLPFIHSSVSTQQKIILVNATCGNLKKD